MTPVAVTDTPMDLSMKTRRKLRLEEFLRQNLDQAPARRVIQWVDREMGIFRILWTHQSSGAFTQEDAALFRYWALARGKPASVSSVELKQSLRMALNKSPSVERLSASHDEYRYFKFTEWGSRGSAGGHKSYKAPEGAGRKGSPNTKPPPPLVPISGRTEESPGFGGRPLDNPHLPKNEGFEVAASNESHLSLPTIFPCASPVFSWPGGEHRLGGGMGDHILGEQIGRRPREQLREGHPMNQLITTDQYGRGSLHTEYSMRGNLLKKELLRQQLTSEKVQRAHSAGDHMFGDRSVDHTFRDRSMEELMFGDRSVGDRSIEDHVFGDRSVYHTFRDRSVGDGMFGDRSVGDGMFVDRSVDHMFENHRVYPPKTSPPQACIETTESYQLVPSSKDYHHHRLECESCLSLYSDGGSFPKQPPNYDYRSIGTKMVYHSCNNSSVPLINDFHDFKNHYFDLSFN
ncbi:interferon regulatory factor 4-like [Procambarus clarkii]|uniref:interferon regulatory factor 4 n=1 Tax=Procambarus clarkii TaxID=6728 RepID=UPI0037449337